MDKQLYNNIYFSKVMAFDLRLVTNLYISSLHLILSRKISLSNVESFKRMDSSCLFNTLRKEKKITIYSKAYDSN